MLSDPKSNKVDFRDLLVAIEVFRENSFYDKMVNFLDLCDMENDDYIEEKTLFNVLKGICLNSDESERLKRFSKGGEGLI